jgi:MOSC domain-containing protein YiiM
MEEVPEIRALEEYGFEGCAHARPGSTRQVLLLDLETLDVLELRPGRLRENITTTGLNVNGLALGQQLRVGGSRLQVTAVCTPCNLLEKIRPGLRREIRGRRGMLCRVLAGGLIGQGDPIEKLEQAP